MVKQPVAVLPVHFGVLCTPAPRGIPGKWYAPARLYGIL